MLHAYISCRCDVDMRTWWVFVIREEETLQHAATYCNTLQHTATHCNTLQRIAHTTYVVGVCDTGGGDTATRYNTLQHYVYVYVCVCVCMCMCMYVYVYVRVCVCMCMCMYVYVYVC